jgi:hypothetical protein
LKIILCQKITGMGSAAAPPPRVAQLHGLTQSHTPKESFSRLIGALQGKILDQVKCVAQNLPCVLRVGYRFVLDKLSWSGKIFELKAAQTI